jgi:hypothetical protein
VLRQRRAQERGLLDVACRPGHSGDDCLTLPAAQATAVMTWCQPSTTKPSR